ncbi:MAG TPA: hypothetical protein VFD92_04565 [Candidatus Binatia bacterium]|nr:hypothetical protein [Candidatus Binatia bacterium]
MDKAGTIDRLIASGKYKDEARDWLSKLADGQLAEIASASGCSCEGAPAGASASGDGKPAPVAAASAGGDKTPETQATPTAAAASTATPAPATAAAEAPATSAPAAASTQTPVAAAKPLTDAEWLAAAPAGVREELEDLRRERAAKENTLREKIAANSGGKLSKEFLASKGLKELEVLYAATIPVDQSGRGTSGDAMTAAAAGDKNKNETPPMPACDFSKA